MRVTGDKQARRQCAVAPGVSRSPSYPSSVSVRNGVGLWPLANLTTARCGLCKQSRSNTLLGKPKPRCLGASVKAHTTSDRAAVSHHRAATRQEPARSTLSSEHSALKCHCPAVGNRYSCTRSRNETKHHQGTHRSERQRQRSVCCCAIHQGKRDKTRIKSSRTS